MSASKKLFLVKRPNKFYYIRIVSDDKTTWKSTGCKNKSEAVEFLKSFEENQNKKPVVTIPTLSEFKKTYSALNSSNLRPRSLHHNLSNIDVFIAIAGDKKLDEYTSAEFELLRTKQIAKGWCVVTANTFTRSIKAVFNFAVNQDIIPVHPFAKVKPLKTPKKAPLFLTPDEFKNVMKNVTNDKLRDLYVFAAFTGLRLSEILNLKQENIDLANKVIKVSNTDTFTTKSGKERIVPISDNLVDVIKRQKSGVYLFGKNGKYVYDGCYISRSFRNAVLLTKGINPKIHMHSLRHTFASWCVQSGVSIYLVKDLLGHSSVNTTEIYSHLSHSSLHEAIRQLPVF